MSKAGFLADVFLGLINHMIVIETYSLAD
jgi:hypothetical protein